MMAKLFVWLYVFFSQNIAQWLCFQKYNSVPTDLLAIQDILWYNLLFWGFL